MLRDSRRNRFLVLLVAALLVFTGCNEEETPKGASTAVVAPPLSGTATVVQPEGLVKWQTQLGDYTADGGLVVSDGTVYVVTEHGNPNDFINFTPCLCALDAQTGIKKWAFAYAGSQATAPTVSKGFVYFSVSHPSPDIPDNSLSYLYALDATTGKEKWHFQVDSLQPAQPLVEDGVVYFPSLRDRHTISDGSGQIIAGGAFIHALRADTGELIWKEKFNGDNWPAAVIDNDTLYFVEQIEYTDISEELYINALDLQSRNTKWQFKISEPYPDVEKLIVANNMVYVSERDKIRALDAGTGEARWSYTADIGLGSSGTTGSCCMYSLSKPQKQAPHDAFAIQASAVYTSYAPPFPGLKTLPEVAGDTLVVGLGLRDVTSGSGDQWGDMDGYMLGLDAVTGKERWRTYVHRVMYGWDAPIVRKETAYLVAYTAEAPWGPSGPASLIALDTRSGSILWKKPLDGLPLPVSKGIDNNMLIASGWHGEVYAISLPTTGP
jgi:outer membrane protein assembly factor BamB